MGWVGKEKEERAKVLLKKIGDRIFERATEFTDEEYLKNMNLIGKVYAQALNGFMTEYLYETIVRKAEEIV
jgi:hypothetical protein